MYSSCFREIKWHTHLILQMYLIGDWHLANQFSYVYVSVVVSLIGLYHHSTSSWPGPCISVNAPLTPTPYFTGKHKTWEGSVISGSSFELGQEGQFGLIPGIVVVIIQMESGLMGYHLLWYCVGRIPYGLKVRFCFIHATQSHYHRRADLLHYIEHIRWNRIVSYGI